jgi:hypothetical protein
MGEEPSHTVSGMSISTTTPMESSMEVPQKNKKIELPYNPAIKSWAYIQRSINQDIIKTLEHPCLL